MNGYNEIRTLYQIDSLYAWKNGLYYPPVMVEISPTNSCNQKCRYCYASQGNYIKESMRDDILIDFFNQAANAGVKAVLVQGTGEPLMHKAMAQAIEEGAKTDLSIALTTNGVLFNKSIQDRILQHLFYVKFSVLDIDTKRYAYLHGCSEKQLDLLIENVKYAVALREKNALNVGLWATVYIDNIELKNVYDVVKFYKEIGLDYIVVQEATYTELSPSGKAEYNSSKYSDEEIEEFKTKLLTLRDEDFEIKIRVPINDNNYFVGLDTDSWQKNYCQGINFYTLISGDGEIYPCWRMWEQKEYSYGSLYKNTFEEIWKSDRRKEIDKYVNSMSPTSDECKVCNIGKLNSILSKLSNDNNKWKNFLT